MELRVWHSLDYSKRFLFFQKVLLKMAAKTARRAVEDDLTNVEFETSEDVEVIPTFDSMGLREDLLRLVPTLCFCA